MISNRQLFIKHIAQTSDAPLLFEIEKAEGCWIYDVNGKKYLDLISGISVSNLGHQNPAVKKTIIDQLDKYAHIMVYGEVVQSPQIKLAEWLANHLPGTLNSVYYTNSGSEAVEGAIKLVKRITGRTEIFSFKNSYHGSTQGALSLGNNEERKNAFRPLIPDNRIADFNDFEQLEFITGRTAAVIIEIVQAEAGVILPSANYLAAVRNKCNATGTLLIFDECQTGFGRTGKLFAFEKYHVMPDVLVLGKAFGGGLPLGAFIASKEMMDTFTNHPVLGHLTTFGGHPVSCAAGLAAAEELMRLNLISDVERKAGLIKRNLIHPKIKSIRDAGLLMAIEFESAEFNLALNRKLIEAGLLVDWFLFAPHCLRIAPPLIISDEEIEFAMEIILNCLK